MGKIFFEPPKLNSANIILPHEGMRKPTWFQVSDEQMQKVQRLITSDVWQSNSVTGFESSIYKTTGFPFRVGSMEESYEAIYKSRLYRLASISKALKYKRARIENVTPMNFTDKVPAAFQPAAAQMMVAGHHLFGERPLVWKFTLDISRVKKGKIHRRIAAVGDDFHMDRDPEYHLGVNNPGYGFTSSDMCATEFKGKPRFAEKDMVAYIGEDHRSPIVDRNGVRVFIRGVASDPRYMKLAS